MALLCKFLFPGVALGLLTRQSELNDPCSVDHTADLYKPMKQVIQENPGVDMYCYFETAGKIYAAKPNADPGLRIWVHRRNLNERTDYMNIAIYGAEGMKLDPATCGDGWKGDGKGPLATFHYEGGTIQSHLDCQYYSYDDLYFYSLGWLKNQGLDGSLLYNSTAWEEQAAKECEKIEKEIQPTPEETSLGYNADQNGIIAMKAGCAAISQCPAPVTLREFKLHIYTKCLMGGAANEMAYGFGRACLLKDNMIGHGIQCK